MFMHNVYIYVGLKYLLITINLNNMYENRLQKECLNLR